MNKTDIKCNIFDKIKAMEFSKKDIKYLILLFLFFGANILVFGGHITNLYMDMGREFYFPLSMLNGEVLYKDIFNIFGPFAYLFNTLLFKLFGVSFSVIYDFAVLNSLLIVFLTYVLSKRFLDRFSSFSITLLCIFAGCHSLGFSTYFLPYTYAIVYGTTFALLSIILFLKFFDNGKKLFLHLSFLMSGFAVSNKYEFFVLPVLLFAMLLWCKRQDLKTYLLGFVLSCAPIVSMFLFLFAQGLNVADLVRYLHLLIAYAKSTPLKILYLNIGVYPSFVTIKTCLGAIAVFALTLSALFGCFKIKKIGFRAAALTAACAGIFLGDILYSLNNLFVGISVLNTVLALLFVKKIIKRPDFLFLVCAALLLSLKSYWKMIAFGGYGLFVINLNLIVLLYIMSEFAFATEENRMIFKKAFCTNLFIVMVLALVVHLNVFSQTKAKVQTQNASFYTTPSAKLEFEEITAFIKNNVKNDESVIILPEGLFMNFAVGAKSDNYFNIFTPDRADAYKEEKIIEHYKKTKPDYFILIDSDYILYGTPYICKDFAQGLCRYVGENYRLEKAVKYERSLLMFKKI